MAAPWASTPTREEANVSRATPAMGPDARVATWSMTARTSLTTRSGSMVEVPFRPSVNAWRSFAFRPRTGRPAPS